MTDKNEWVDKGKVYAISRSGKPANELAMYANPAFRDFEGICYLTPGERGHMIEGHLEERTDTGFTFISEGFASGRWEFIEVTYENFKSEYHKIVIGGNKILNDVSDTQELIDWFHREFPMR